MLKNSNYIYNNNIIADEIKTTKKFCKKAQVGVDLSVRNIFKIEGVGKVSTKKTYVPPYIKINVHTYDEEEGKVQGWFLDKGTYICELNEGIFLDSHDTGMIIMRSSLNRCGVSIQAALWDPGFTTKDNNNINPMNVRLTVDNEKGFLLEENARVAQLIILENEDSSLYDGQFQSGRITSKLV